MFGYESMFVACRAAVARIDFKIRGLILINGMSFFRLAVSSGWNLVDDHNNGNDDINIVLATQESEFPYTDKS